VNALPAAVPWRGEEREAAGAAGSSPAQSLARPAPLGWRRLASGPGAGMGRPGGWMDGWMDVPPLQEWGAPGQLARPRAAAACAPALCASK
jgi:hypothetical protein